MLWFDPTDLMHYPAIVDKTLFNLKQVAHEVETSVMSKVSCTACKAGKRKKSTGNSISPMNRRQNPNSTLRTPVFSNFLLRFIIQVLAYCNTT